MINPRFISRLAFLATLLLTITACDESNPLEIPANTSPVISLGGKESTYQEKLGATITIPLNLADQEGMKLFRVTAKHIDNQGDVVSQGVVLLDQPVNGTLRSIAYPYTIPLTYQPYDKILFTFYVLDNEGLWDSAFAEIHVLPEPASPGLDYPLQSYPNNILRRSGKFASIPANPQSVFSFAARSYPTLVADQDIADNVPGVSSFEPVLSSPNNGNSEDIFVVTDASVFNYDACTYETIWQAYQAARQPTRMTPKLKTGDIVVVKLKPANLPHPMFAVMRITQIVIDPANPLADYFVFDYKYSYKKI